LETDAARSISGIFEPNLLSPEDCDAPRTDAFGKHSDALPASLPANISTRMRSAHTLAIFKNHGSNIYLPFSPLALHTIVAIGLREPLASGVRAADLPDSGCVHFNIFLKSLNCNLDVIFLRHLNLIHFNRSNPIIFWIPKVHLFGMPNVKSCKEMSLRTLAGEA